MGWCRIVVSALALASLAAGCGGDDNQASPANTPEVTGESYASTVCFIAVSWSGVSTAIDDYSAQKASGQDVVDAVTQAQAATNEYVLDIRGLPQPDDPTQSASYTSLQKTADQVSSLSQSIQTNVDELPTGADKAQSQIERIYRDLETSVDQLDAIYPESGVAAAVAEHPNCDELHA